MSAASIETARRTMDVIDGITRIAHDARLGIDERLHYLRTIRLNLSGQEDRLVMFDEAPPCLVEKFGDIAHSLQHAAANPED